MGSTIVIVILAAAAILLVFSLLKRLIKLAFVAVVLALLLAGIWYLLQDDPGQARETLREVGGEAVGRAGELIQEGAEQVMEKAGEVVDGGAEQAIDRMGEVIEEGTEMARDAAGEAVAITVGEEGEGEGGETEPPEVDSQHD